MTTLAGASRGQRGTERQPAFTATDLPALVCATVWIYHLAAELVFD